MHDIIIIGGGPAGLTAALYALRANKSVLIIEESAFGGQITYSPKVENYPGFMSLSGNELADKLVEQVLEQGAEVEVGKVTKVLGGEIKTVVTEDGEFNSKSVIIAVGVKHRMLGIENEKDFIGKGISFCAVCDGAFYRDKHVAVIGGGNSALQEALLLAENCKKVTIVQNLADFTGEKKLIDTVKAKDNIECIYNAVVKSLNGEDDLDSIVLNVDGKDAELSVDGMFIAIGLEPKNDAFKNLAGLDSRGYFDSDESCSTKTNGIFVAGDCRQKTVRQVTTATSDGAIAALNACNYIDNM